MIFSINGSKCLVTPPRTYPYKFAKQIIDSLPVFTAEPRKIPQETPLHSWGKGKFFGEKHPQTLIVII